MQTLLSEDRGISVGVMYPGDHTPDGIPLIKAGDLAGNRINRETDFRISPEKHYEYRRTELEGGELLISLVGDVGRCAVVPASMAGWNAARAIAVIRLKNKEDVHYLRACLLSPPLQHLMRMWATTTVQATLNLKEIKQLPILWAPENERKQISEIVGAFDDKIELNRRENTTLEATARALFQSWFVEFDPVRAKSEGRQPVGMDAETAALFTASFEESALGMIPKGWRVGCLGDIVEIIREGINPGDVDQLTPYIGLEHMPRRSIAISDWGQASEVDSGKSLFHVGDFLFGKLRPYFHKVGIAPVDGVCSTDILVLSSQESEWYSFAILQLSSDTFVNYTDMTSTGTKMPRASWKDMARYQVVLPSPELANLFNDYIESMFATIRCNIHESRTLAAMRDTLLPKLLSGEVRV